jgi:hypothetical protein
MTEPKQQSPLLEMYELFAGLPSSVCTDILSTARPSRLLKQSRGDDTARKFRAS